VCCQRFSARSTRRTLRAMRSCCLCRAFARRLCAFCCRFFLLFCLIPLPFWPFPAIAGEHSHLLLTIQPLPILPSMQARHDSVHATLRCNSSSHPFHQASHTMRAFWQDTRRHRDNSDGLAGQSTVRHIVGRAQWLPPGDVLSFGHGPILADRTSPT
jgi:hypothetical protein